MINHHENKKTGSCELCCTKIENFNISFGSLEVLKDVNLHIHCGELTAIIGQNGSGKSTLLKAILGVTKHKGELKFLDAKGKKADKPVIGYVPQKINLERHAPASVYDLFAASISKVPAWCLKSKKLLKKITESLEKVEAVHLIDRRIGLLSGGELQRVMLALALQPVPNILLLDEPVSGVDYSGMEMFYQLVSEIRSKYDSAIILVSHDLPLVAKYADKVVFLDKTVAAIGSPKEVFSNKKVIEAFGLKEGELKFRKKA